MILLAKFAAAMLMYAVAIEAVLVAARFLRWAL